MFAGLDRDEHGRPQFRTQLGKPLSSKALHRMRCFLLGIRCEEDIATAWEQEQAKRKAVSPTRKRRRRT